ncbi:MAG: hypothetical protein JXK04_06230 [Campylobacterales bacterium]|nr:hypothetical protein [Campylobacterales bacterium]
MNFIYRLLVASCILVPSAMYADCVIDSLGNVYCSKYPNGGAKLNNLGNVACGKGECATNNLGTVYCSKIQGGGAALDSLGSVRCLGGCEEGSMKMCEAGKI